MKKLLSIVFLLLTATLAFAANKESKPVCMEMKKFNSSMDPLFMTQSAIECIKKNRYDDGVSIWMLMSAYGHFDRSRVVDVSAHQASGVLEMAIGGAIKNRDKWSASYNKSFEDKNFEKLCSDIKQIGMPQYYPNYMIRHGLGVSSERGDILADFNATVAWQKTLDNYMHCK